MEAASRKGKTRQDLNGVLECIIKDSLCAEGVCAINRILERMFERAVHPVDTYLSHIKGNWGKQMRARLCLVSALAFGLSEITEDLSTLGAGIEMIHTATLIHDDIIDKAELRRNKKTINTVFGDNHAILVGDHLFVKAFGLCSSLPAFVVEQTERACENLVAGELIELSLPDMSKKQAIEIARLKTGSLFGLATCAGSYLALRDRESALRLWDYGETLGIIFQLADDIMDVNHTTRREGKKPLADLTHKRPSIVNALWLESGSSIARDFFANNRAPTDMQLERALRDIEERCIVDMCLEEVDFYCSKGLGILDDVLNRQTLNDENNIYVKALKTFPSVIVNRVGV